MNQTIDPSILEARALAARMTPLAVQAHLVWHAAVDVAERQSWGQGPRGERWSVPILGGWFWGAEGFEDVL